jgi:hypothetical protein
MRTGVRGDGFVHEKTETIAIRLPTSVVAAIDAAATEIGASRGNFLACMIIERMEKNEPLYYELDAPKTRRK